MTHVDVTEESNSVLPENILDDDINMMNTESIEVFSPTCCSDEGSAQVLDSTVQECTPDCPR